MINNIKEGTSLTITLASSNVITLTVIDIDYIKGILKGIDSNGQLVIINIKKIVSIIFSPFPHPTYTEISIPVPQTSGLPNLPSRMYFYVDTRFTQPQQQRITNAISLTLFEWNRHYVQKWNNGISQWAVCSNKYATRNLSPIWYRGPAIPNGQVALEFAMDQFTRLIRDNGFQRAPKAKIDSRIPTPPTSSTIRAITAPTQFQVPLSMVINPIQLDNLSMSNVFLSGSMIHAWLHRAGYVHPKTTNYFISEAPMCVMRGFQNKVPGQPDSDYYKYFD